VKPAVEKTKELKFLPCSISQILSSVILIIPYTFMLVIWELKQLKGAYGLVLSTAPHFGAGILSVVSHFPAFL